VVRLQIERGHSVAAGGPYRFVRHPAYLAMIVFEVAISSVLGSWPAILVGSGCALLFILRTALEDRTLQAGLPGYAEYARLVRYRLLPEVW
jgi:protein-S-isoprenylcysteine O-methyltransferase Ste14